LRLLSRLRSFLPRRPYFGIASGQVAAHMRQFTLQLTNLLFDCSDLCVCIVRRRGGLRPGI
jgi:hypothetical protein